MITCPNIGALRAALDDANGAESRETLGHADACPTCRAELVEIRSNAEFARSAFALLAEPTSEPSRKEGHITSPPAAAASLDSRGSSGRNRCSVYRRYSAGPDSNRSIPRSVPRAKTFSSHYRSRTGPNAAARAE
jgi:hypothetical protein